MTSSSQEPISLSAVKRKAVMMHLFNVNSSLDWGMAWTSISANTIY
jgi:hypothetical protein